MIIGIGIDLIEIERFVSWADFPHTRLLKVFTPHEIEYSFSDPTLTASRLAARFAAKEAFFKALSSAHASPSFSLMPLCPFIEVIQSPNRAPYLQLDVQGIETNSQATYDISTLTTHLSLTHAAATAGAFVIIESP